MKNVLFIHQVWSTVAWGGYIDRGVRHLVLFKEPICSITTGGSRLSVHLCVSGMYLIYPTNVNMTLNKTQSMIKLTTRINSFCFGLLRIYI